MGKQCWSQAVLELGSWGHSVLQTPALVSRAPGQVNDFNNRNKILTVKLLKQENPYHKLHLRFPKFYRRHSALVSRYNIGLKTLLKVCQNLNFMAT